MIDNWNKLLVEDYFKVLRITNDNTLNNYQKEMNIVSILSGIELSKIGNMDIKQYNKLLSKLSFLSEPIPTSKIPNHLTIDNKLFKVTNNISELTASEYIDLVILSENWETDMISILSLFIKPAKVSKNILGNKYTVIEYDRVELIEFLNKHLTIDIANNLMVFFYKVYNSLISYTKHYLGLEMIKMERLMKKTGIPQAKVKELKDGLAVLQEYLGKP